MEEILILFKNDPDHDKNNIMIINHLNEQYQTLNKLKFKIRPVIVNNNNIDNYTRIGVKGLPALVYKEDDIKIGSKQIINFLTKCCIVNTSKSTAKIKSNQFNNMLMEYALSKDDDEDNDDENPKHLEKMVDEGEIGRKVNMFNKQKHKVEKPRPGNGARLETETRIKTKNKIEHLDADEQRAMEIYGLGSDGEPDFDEDDEYDINYNSD